ncbi:AAA family ATPase [Sphaerisporangium aureirubrum]|uniref:AAA family ATPase n=1 Tax=Sphaerisporangium aureirubrum TaxID=1544736 RepID=A0ABW1NMK4_9ACTN
MRRVLVVGTTGAGKTTMARSVAGRLQIPYHEMDSLYFAGPGWAVAGDFAAKVAEIASGPGWVLDSFGQAEVRDLLWRRADTVVWLDYRRSVVMPRVLRRSLRRTLLREDVYGGNREKLSEWLTADHPAWSAWSQHAPRRTLIRERTTDARFAPLQVIRLPGPREAAAWLRTL